MKANKDQTIHEVLRQFPYGIYVVGVSGGKTSDDRNALVASWVTQCSFSPPLLLVALRKPSLTYDLVKQGKVFSVNLIDRKNTEIAKQLVKPAGGQATDKLENIETSAGDTGAPVLRQAYAFLECEVRQMLEPGDHVLVIGEVVKAGCPGKGEPMLCSDMRWHYAGNPGNAAA